MWPVTHSLTDWNQQLLDGIDGLQELDQDLILDVAKQAAHTIARPAAPLTTYALGVAVGAGMSVADACALIDGLLATWDRDER
ncbi:MAG: molybdopterin-guanine dinucleotide biosynthesis protein [Actinobacteria bacterium]|nr:molybdopterin-guanine dinucleotide biosynthesis protein [Actinomycetota bacterium]